jgi:iron(III) transport system substrate-binding protein
MIGAHEAKHMMRFLILALLGLFAAAAPAPDAAAAAPAPYAVTPALVAAAKKEGAVTYYTSLELLAAERLAKAFEQKYPGIKVRVERAGSERVFQRIGQEYSSRIHNADAVDTSDAVHFAYFKKRGWLQPAVPADVVKFWPAEMRDPDGAFAAFRGDLSVIAYNRRQVAAADAPKSFADLLLPKWKGRLVKAHPGYSGTIMTATHALSKTLGWDYFAKLGKQNVMQVQSSTEPPKKLAQGERAVQVDGNEYVVVQQQKAGMPLQIVYAAEGTPLIIGDAAILKFAPHPNAAKLFYAFMFSLEGQQLNSDFGGVRSFHPGVKDNSGRPPLDQIKLLRSDTKDLEANLAAIKRRYEQYFGT